MTEAAPFLVFVRSPDMRRALIAGIILAFCGAISVRSRPSPLTFVFVRVDRQQGVAILRPMIAPDIGVQLDAGPKQLARGTVLQCEPTAHSHSALVEDKVSTVTELLLDCGDHRFVVKTLVFAPSEQ
jgi:hypothetical protein